jgi:signal transduction histidine kinase
VEERTEQLKNAERLSAIGETAAMVCHDLRKPLQSLFCMVYLAKERLNLGNVSHLEGQVSMEEILDNMKESVYYMSMIASGIPDYARKLSLNHLATNSLNAMPEGGQMSISVRQSGDFVRISVKGMVDAMGGNIAINSRLGEGTEAVIEIPVR